MPNSGKLPIDYSSMILPPDWTGGVPQDQRWSLTPITGNPVKYKAIKTMDGRYSREDYMRLLSMRLRVPEGHLMPMKHLDIFVGDNTAFVFVVTDSEKTVTLEDDPKLFPSDKLIAELTILMDAK